METTTHRKRYRREKTTGNIHINDSRRDRILDPLCRYARLPTNHLQALYGSEYVKQILKRLYHETAGLPATSHILSRPDEINRHIGTHLFHELGPGAYQHTRHAEDFIRRTKIGKSRRSAHDTHLCMIVASIEASIKAPQRFVSHLEILAHPKCSEAARTAEVPVSFPLGSTTLEPDALFGIKSGGEFKFFVLELDRHTESLTVIDEKLRHYEQVLRDGIYKTHLGLPNLRVLWLTHSTERETNIRARVQRHHDAHLFHTIPRFNLFDNAPAPCLSLIGDEWKTAHGTTRLLEGR